jgi:hypothetical protein
MRSDRRLAPPPSPPSAKFLIVSVARFRNRDNFDFALRLKGIDAFALGVDEGGGDEDGVVDAGLGVGVV